MPKVDKRRGHSRHLNYRRSVESIGSNETEAYSSEEEEILINPDTDIDHNNFSDESVLNDISNLFSFFSKRKLTLVLSACLCICLYGVLIIHGETSSHF